ncbi:MAG: hypothetical protein ABEJ73_07625 [Haloplanus sp.]
MVPSGFPTGTVSSGRDGPSASPGRDDEGDARARIAELERENEALRAALEQQRRENERIVERYERLLDCDRPSEAEDSDATGDVPDIEAGAFERIARAFGFR